MFVRAKTIKGKKYGYLVENSWVKGKVKQQVKQYLGKLYELPELSEIQACTTSFEKSTLFIQELIINDLEQRGFVHNKERKELSYETITISYYPFLIKENNKDIVLVLNKRYTYAQLLTDLCEFYEPEDSNSRPGAKLAKAFKVAGIQIAKENFVELYKLLYM